ncbi:winged helix-turn-helix domain-containing protein [Klebsiella michiganensis]|uniref:winged helix-turn-helix domain-containing protein n=1 Tax=Klebsiella michiganensis TaxID=1134687 RepID=UPI0022450270|nr:winged helix-turn-helix domain-containing protein [Klebsiella michiganensis]MCW9449797.1 winged helix-turn-helix domain-containing protein [Klebsiella michiganensis]
MIFNEYIINNEVIFNVDMNELQPVGENGDSVTLNVPTARCLQLLLESNGKIISREEFLDIVWKNRGIVVSQNTFYQNISLLRKSLLKAGLSQDIIVTVRQRGFVLAAGSNIASFFRTDEKEPENPENVQITASTSSPPVENNVTHNLAIQEDAQKNFNDNKATEFKLPKWILPLLLVMTAANILSLFL